MNNCPKEAPAGVGLGNFQKTKPLTFTIAPDPMVARDWLTDTERKLDTVGCVIQSIVYLPTWEVSKSKLRETHIPSSIMELNRKKFLALS